MLYNSKTLIILHTILAKKHDYCLEGFVNHTTVLCIGYKLEILFGQLELQENSK